VCVERENTSEDGRSLISRASEVERTVRDETNRTKKEGRPKNEEEEGKEIKEIK
jgi:hypothetical protein